MSIDVYGGILTDNALESVGDSSVNLGNRNFVILMDALGIVADPCGHMEIDKFLGLARAWLQANINRPSAVVPSREFQGEGGCTMIDLPMRAGFVNRQMHAIVTMLARAKTEGATYVYWG